MYPEYSAIIDRYPLSSIQDSRFTIDNMSGSTGGSSYMFEGPEDDGIRHSISVKLGELPGHARLDSLVDEQRKQLSQELESFQEINHGPVELNQATPAYELIYKWTPSGKREIFTRNCIY